MPPIDPAAAQTGTPTAARTTGFKHDAFTPRLGPTSAEWRKTDTGSTDGVGFWGDDGFTFGDLLDLVNPLQHIPIVASVYRGLTGDEIAPGPRLIGDGLFSLTPLGAAASMAVAAFDIALESKTGSTMGGHLASAVGIGDGVDDATPATRFAEVNGLPWLQETALRQVAAQEIADPSPGKPEPAIAPSPIAASVVAPSVATQPISANGDTTTMAADVPEMSPDQWTALLAGLETDDGSTDAPVAPPRDPRPAATDVPLPVAPAPVPREAVAAAMTDALDKYATLQRLRSGRGMEIDQEL